ncbi:uncharacterized protein BDR25DRAFT_244571, partial [Lindgomyces ingoldianus]
AIGKIKRAHAPLQRAYNILCAELDNYTNNKLVLQIAVKALNNIIRLNSLIPTLLMFKTYLRINIDSALSSNIITQANAVQKVIKML